MAQARLRRTRDVQRVRESGEARADRLFHVAGLPCSESWNRIAVRTPVRLGTAVARNRVRRRVRAAFAEALRALERPLDVVVTARAGAVSAPFAELRRSARDLLRGLAGSSA